MYLNMKTDCYVGKTRRTDKSMCFLYTFWFCIRRLCLVLCFFITWNNGSMIQTIFGLLCMQTCYLWYVAGYKPHIEIWFNSLEFVNEVLMVFIIYTLFGFLVSDIPSLLTLRQQWRLGYVTIGLIIIIFIINFIGMIYSTFNRINYFIHLRTILLTDLGGHISLPKTAKYGLI